MARKKAQQGEDTSAAIDKAQQGEDITVTNEAQPGEDIAATVEAQQGEDMPPATDKAGDGKRSKAKQQGEDITPATPTPATPDNNFNLALPGGYNISSNDLSDIVERYEAGRMTASDDIAIYKVKKLVDWWRITIKHAAMPHTCRRSATAEALLHVIDRDAAKLEAKLNIDIATMKLIINAAEILK